MLNTTGEDFGSYYNVSGILIYDPILGDREVSTNAAMVDYVLANKNLFVAQSLSLSISLSIAIVLTNLKVSHSRTRSMRNIITCPPSADSRT